MVSKFKSLSLKLKIIISVVMLTIIFGCATITKVMIQAPLFKIEVECESENSSVCVTYVTYEDEFWLCDFAVEKSSVSLDMLKAFCKKIQK